MKRNKKEMKYWRGRIDDLIKLDPKFKKVKNIFDGVKLIIQKRHPHIKDKDNIQMIKDIVMVDRLLRNARVGEEPELKKQLSQEFQVEMGYEGGYLRDVKMLKQL